MSYENIDLEIKYQDLVQQLVEGIPHLSKKWTNHNISDFGIVMLELYAFVADNYLYKINRVPDEVIFGFLQNFLLTTAQLQVNSSNSQIPGLDNTTLADDYDYLWTRLKMLLSQPVGTEAALKEFRNFIDDPYRLITKEDAIHICRNLLPTLRDTHGQTSFSLKGIDVNHDQESYKFEIVFSAEGTANLNDRTLLVNSVTLALKRRKLLGTKIEVKYAPVAEVTAVEIHLRFSTKTSEWNRDTETLIKRRIQEYFKTTARGGDLSLYQEISLFEMYSFVEELEAVDFVEKIVVKVNGEILTDEDPNSLDYQVLFQFSGEITPPQNNTITVKRIL